MSGSKAMLTIGVAIMSAWWTTGGRGALQRRKIQHELDLGDRLRDPLLRDRVKQSADEHAAIYLGRTLHADASTKTFLLTITPLLVGIGTITLTSRIDEIPELARATCNLLSVALIVGGFGAIVDSVMRDGLAWLGAARSEQARARLAAHEAVDLHSGKWKRPPAARQRANAKSAGHRW